MLNSIANHIWNLRVTQMKQPVQLIFLCSLFAALLAQESSAQTLHARLNTKKSAVEVFRNEGQLRFSPKMPKPTLDLMCILFWLLTEKAC